MAIIRKPLLSDRMNQALARCVDLQSKMVVTVAITTEEACDCTDQVQYLLIANSRIMLLSLQHGGLLAHFVAKAVIRQLITVCLQIILVQATALAFITIKLVESRSVIVNSSTTRLLMVKLYTFKLKVDRFLPLSRTVISTDVLAEKDQQLDFGIPADQ